VTVPSDAAPQKLILIKVGVDFHVMIAGLVAPLDGRRPGVRR
jgi:hypothetical protein